MVAYKLRNVSPFSCQNAAKQAAAAATQTIAAAQHAASSNKNQAAQQQLVQSCKVNTTYMHEPHRTHDAYRRSCSFLPATLLSVHSYLILLYNCLHPLR